MKDFIQNVFDDFKQFKKKIENKTILIDENGIKYTRVDDKSLLENGYEWEFEQKIKNPELIKKINKTKESIIDYASTRQLYEWNLWIKKAY